VKLSCRGFLGFTRRICFAQKDAVLPFFAFEFFKFFYAPQHKMYKEELQENTRKIPYIKQKQGEKGNRRIVHETEDWLGGP
jgi:hypothetical protein